MPATACPGECEGADWRSALNEQRRRASGKNLDDELPKSRMQHDTPPQGLIDTRLAFDLDTSTAAYGARGARARFGLAARLNLRDCVEWVTAVGNIGLLLRCT